MPITIPIPADPTDTLRRWETEIAKHPRQAAARYQYAVALQNSGDPAGAVEQASHALALDPRLRGAARVLAALLQRYEINPTIDVSARGLEAAFAFDDVDRQALSTATTGYLKARPPLARILETGIAENWDAAARSLLSKSGRPLLKDKLFRAALAFGFNTDPLVEELLTAFRRHLLLALDRDRLRDRALYEFACAVVQQCANNEYVFFAADDELHNVRILEEDFAREPGSADTPDNLLLLALYRPVHELVPESDNRVRIGKSIPRALRNVLQPIWKTREEEDECSQTVLRMMRIVNETSKRVEHQYRGDPYPRWLSMQTPETGIARQSLTAFFDPPELGFLDTSYKVLIAGCGTGQQAVNAALGYGPDADVLAVDLSTRSLGYATRMAARYDVPNLRFAQADILGLADADDTFDIIECVGVLHHMAAPYDAWRILADRLRPGGLMLTGLYSAVSRQGLSALRDDPAWPGDDANDEALRAFRRTLMRRPPGAPGTELLLSKDFFVKSGFRDLALHVSEQQCTLPEIEAFLEASHLEFHGFQLPRHVLEQFLTAYPDDGLPGRLDNWRAFEQEHPRTFDGMYNFWCRKA